MTQTADPQPQTMEEILQILRNQAIATPNPTTSTRYLRALESFQSSAISHQHLDSSLLTLDSLQLRCTDWLITLWLTNTPFTTASLYLDIISSLYGSAAKAGLLPPTKLFSDLKTSLKALGPEGWRQGIDDEIFARSLRLTKNARHLLADDHTAAQLVLYSLTHGLIPLTQVAQLKKSETHAKPQRDHCADGGEYQAARALSTLKAADQTLASSREKSRERYAFPLRQSQRTPKQLSQHISQIVNNLFRRSRLPQATDPYQTVEALWSYAALRAGIPASTLVAHLGHTPLGLPVLKLSNCVAMERRRLASAVPSAANLMDPDRLSPGVTDERAAGLSQGDSTADNSSLIIDHLSLIGKVFLENEPRWYAMQLRPGVRFTDLSRRIDQLRAPSPFTLHSSHLAEGLELFYPSEEITRLIGKKIVTRQRPFIHSVVFFRAKLTDIGRLFSKIGDLAWCYRQSARPGAPYADISDRQFQLFQQTIAHFTPDYEIAASGDLELHEGDRVEILGGLFQGQTATVVEGSRVKSQESRPVAKGEESRVKGQGSENSSLIIDHSSLGNTVYRLNLIGDNGIDWRITVDPRLLKTT